MRTTGSPEELERRRLLAAKLFDQQRSPKYVAELLQVDVQTARAWRRVYQKQGREGLHAKPHPGAPKRLTDQQRDQLTQMLACTPQHHGFDKHLWTTALIAQLIARQFHVHYHPDYVGTLLHALGFSCQKPCRRARERDETRITHWRQETWPTLLKKKRKEQRSSSPTKPDS